MDVSCTTPLNGIVTMLLKIGTTCSQITHSHLLENYLNIKHIRKINVQCEEYSYIYNFTNPSYTFQDAFHVASLVPLHGLHNIKCESKPLRDRCFNISYPLKVKDQTQWT